MLDDIKHLLYNRIIKGTEQPEETVTKPPRPKASDTGTHIPVSERRNTNSQEDDFGAVPPERRGHEVQFE